MRIWFSLIMVLYSFLNLLIGRQIYDLLRVNIIAFWVFFIILASSPFLSRIGPFSIIEKAGDLWMVFFYLLCHLCCGSGNLY